MTDNTRSENEIVANPDTEPIAVGRIRGGWGLRGDLRVELLTDLPSRFAPGSVVYLDDRPVCVERSRASKNGLLVKLDIANDRTAAESLRGRVLTIPQRDIKPLPDGSYYHFQIVDMGVWSDQGEFLGTVKEILSTGSNDVYVVQEEGRRELLIPALADVVVSVDLGENRMTVRLPEGLR